MQPLGKTCWQFCKILTSYPRSQPFHSQACAHEKRKCVSMQIRVRDPQQCGSGPWGWGDSREEQQPEGAHTTRNTAPHHRNGTPTRPAAWMCPENITLSERGHSARAAQRVPPCPPKRHVSRSGEERAAAGGHGEGGAGDGPQGLTGQCMKLF